jgi:hypothetical protein
MNVFLRNTIYGFISVWVVLIPCMSSAQTSTWSSGSAKAGAAQKAASAKHKLKDFKKHLQEWGMDTSFNHTFLIGGKLNSDGWSGSMYLMKRKNYHVTNFWELSFSEIKHEKQIKQQGTNSAFPELGNTTPYVFGKINNLYTLQVGYGKEMLLLPAVMEGNISVSFRYSGGFSLAMLKPYYLKLIYTDYSTNPATAHLEQQKYSSSDSDLFLNTGTILGAASWSKGLGEITYVPGTYFQAAFAITPGKNKSFVQVVTLGINAALYAETLPIMADQKAYPWEVALFAGLGIGKRWK